MCNRVLIAKSFLQQPQQVRLAHLFPVCNYRDEQCWAEKFVYCDCISKREQMKGSLTPKPILTLPMCALQKELGCREEICVHKQSWSMWGLVDRFLSSGLEPWSKRSLLVLGKSVYCSCRGSEFGWNASSRPDACWCLLQTHVLMCTITLRTHG